MADQVEALLDEADLDKATLHLSTINLGEIVCIVERRHGRASCQKALDVLATFPLQLEQATLDRVLAAAHVKAHHRISYADAFAVALAQELEAAVVTTDPEFQGAALLVDVLWL